jgi:hypothetical protein
VWTEDPCFLQLSGITPETRSEQLAAQPTSRGDLRVSPVPLGSRRTKRGIAPPIGGRSLSLDAKQQISADEGWRWPHRSLH